MKRLIVITTGTLFFICLAGLGVYLDTLNYANKPSGTEALRKVVIVEPGQKFRHFSEMLFQKGLIDHPAKFRLFARIKKYDKNIKAGEYILSSTMTPKKILEITVNGKVYLHKFTVPEGYNLHQVAKAFSRAGFGSETDFFKAATNSDFAHAKGIEGKTFEGYLFPDTYYFPRGITPDQVISTMVKRFWTLFKPEWKERAKTLGLTLHQVVILASMIEKETGVAAERPIISSVFHNRLHRNMRLESDPTVIYAIKNYKGNITRKDLEHPTPYNTYTIKGLPAGPISNVGIKALEAALYPVDTPFIYFVSKKDGTHQFSTNFVNHNKAVRKYQLGR